MYSSPSSKIIFCFFLITSNVFADVIEFKMMTSRPHQRAAKTLATTTAPPATLSIGESPVTTIVPEVTGPSTYTLFKPIRSRIRYIVSSSSLTGRNVSSTTTTTQSTVGPTSRVPAATTLPSVSSEKPVKRRVPTSTSAPSTSTLIADDVYKVSHENKNNQVKRKPAPIKSGGNSGYNPFDDSRYSHGQDREHLNSIASTYAPYVYGGSNNLQEEETTKKTPVLSSLLNREAINTWAKDVLAYFYAPFLVPTAIANAITNAPDGVEHETLFGRTVKSLRMIFAKPQVRKDVEYEGSESSMMLEVTSTTPTPAAAPSSNSTSSGLMSKLKNTSVKWYSKLVTLPKVTLPKVTLASLIRNTNDNSSSNIYDDTASPSYTKESNQQSNLYDDTDTSS